MKKYSSSLVIIGVTVLVLIFYLPIFKGFFQQDEWNLFGHFYTLGDKNLSEILSILLSTSPGHYVPFTQLVTYALFSIFKLNYSGYVAVSVIGHLTTVLLVYIFSKKVFRSSESSFWTALVFGLAASGYQATAWPITSVNVHGATIFALLSLILFKEYVDQKKKNPKLLIISIFCLFISLLFKEIAVAFFVFLGIFYYLYKKGKKIDKKVFVILALSAVLYFGFRSYIFLNTPKETSLLPTATQSLKQVAYNFLSFPLKGFSQTLIFEEILWNVAKVISRALPVSWTGEFGSPQFDNFVYKRVLDVVNFLVAGIIFYLTYKAFKRDKDKRFRNAIVFGVIFVALNSFIYALSPERQGIIPIIDSRNLYFLLIGFSIAFVAVASVFLRKRVYFVFVVSLFLLLNSFFLVKKLANLSETGRVRKYILNTIKTKYPRLPDRVIFYTESDSSYYGLPPEEKILPFQSGFGQTLLVWYYEANKFPNEFYEDNFLWEITDQGYKEVGGRGFGYFRDFATLEKAIRDNKIPLDSVIAFSWYEDNIQLSDETEKVRILLLNQ